MLRRVVVYDVVVVRVDGGSGGGDRACERAEYGYTISYQWGVVRHHTTAAAVVGSSSVVIICATGTGIKFGEKAGDGAGF